MFAVVCLYASAGMTGLALGGVKGPTSRPPSVWVKGGQAI